MVAKGVQKNSKINFSKHMGTTVPVRDQCWAENIHPLVSICCITYNHEQFIRDAIEGFLNQETTFRIEILIHDDASTDGTPRVLRQFESRYPNLFRIVYQQENQYSKGIDPEDILFPLTKGTYIALCEGDDYWTDPRKLQKQIAFLEEHPGFSMCVGGYTSVWEESKESKTTVLKGEPSYDQPGFAFTLDGMQNSWLTKTLTAVFRKCIVDKIDLSSYQYRRDIHLFYHLVKGHQAYYFREDYGVYRIHRGGVNSMNEAKDNYRIAYNCYRELYFKNRDEFTRKKYLKGILTLFNYAVFNGFGQSRPWNKLALIVEALQIIRLRECKMLVAAFLKREWKDWLKDRL